MLLGHLKTSRKARSWCGLPDLTADGDKKQTLVSCHAVGCSSWADPWTGSCLTVTCSSWCFFFTQIVHKPFDLSKNISSFQVCSFMSPWYKVQCFDFRAFQSKETPSRFSRWVLGWDQGKPCTSSRFIDTDLALLVLKWGTLKIPTALKEAGHLQCALSWQGMCGCALAFCMACEELHRDQGQGTSQGARSSAGRCGRCWSNASGALLAYKIHISSDD